MKKNTNKYTEVSTKDVQEEPINEIVNEYRRQKAHDSLSMENVGFVYWVLDLINEKSYYQEMHLLHEEDFSEEEAHLLAHKLEHTDLEDFFRFWQPIKKALIESL